MTPSDAHTTAPAAAASAADPGYELVSETDRLPRAVRGGLAVMAAGLVGVFAVAWWLNPYNPDGTPRSMATHTQLGMPACNMVALTGKPCPACGMTTSFALLVRGDLGASARANWVGTLLAGFWLVLVPWAVAGAVRGKLPVVTAVEPLVTVSVGAFLALSIARWLVVIFQ